MEGLRRCDWGQYQPEFYAQCAPDGGTKLERLKETHLELEENMQTPHKNIYISDCSVFWFLLSNLLLCIYLFNNVINTKSDKHKCLIHDQTAKCSGSMTTCI